MPELTLRDAMVLIGSLLILAVIVDAWRRMRQQTRAQVRMKLAPESSLEACIPTKHPIILWVVRRATDLLNKLEVSRDGKTAYGRWTGKALQERLLR